MTDYDIIAIGGGLVGASLAKAMAEHGRRVLVLERETKFKDRVRGEGMTTWGTAEAKQLGTCFAQDPTRVPDTIFSGPDHPLSDDIRKRFFAEE